MYNYKHNATRTDISEETIRNGKQYVLTCCRSIRSDATELKIPPMTFCR